MTRRFQFTQKALNWPLVALKVFPSTYNTISDTLVLFPGLFLKLRDITIPVVFTTSFPAFASSVYHTKMGLLEYPVDVLILIVGQVSIEDLLRLCSLDRNHRQLFSSNVFWSDKARITDALCGHDWDNFKVPLEVEKVTDNGYFRLYVEKLYAKRRVQKLLHSLDHWKFEDGPVDETELENELHDIVSNHSNYVPFIVAETKRMSSNRMYCKTCKLIPIEEFTDLMAERSTNLSQINLACSLQEIISVKQCLTLYEQLLTGSDKYISSLCLEEVFVLASTIDPLYYDLLHYRKATLDWVVEQYRELEHDPRISLEPICNVVTTLKRLLDFKLNVWRKWDTELPLVDPRNMDHSLVLRVYAGITRPTHLVYLAILEKLCIILGYQQVGINEISTIVQSSHRCSLLVEELQPPNQDMYYDDPDEVHDEPMFEDMFNRFQTSMDPASNAITWTRLVFLNTMDDVFKLIHWNYFKIRCQSVLRLQMNGHISPQPISLGNVVKEYVSHYVYEQCARLKARYTPTCTWLMMLDPPSQKVSYHREPTRDFSKTRILDQLCLRFDITDVGDVVSCPPELANHLGHNRGAVVTINPNKTCYLVDVLVPKQALDATSLTDCLKVARQGGFLLVMRNNSYWTIPLTEFKQNAPFTQDVYTFLAADNIGEWSRGFDLEAKTFVV